MDIKMTAQNIVPQETDTDPPVWRIKIQATGNYLEIYALKQAFEKTLKEIKLNLGSEG